MQRVRTAGTKTLRWEPLSMGCWVFAGAHGLLTAFAGSPPLQLKRSCSQGAHCIQEPLWKPGLDHCSGCAS